MASQCKELVKRSLFLLITLSSQNSLCSIEENQTEIFQNSDYKTKNILGEHCLDIRCSENQFCNEISKCECRFGFVNRYNTCVPCAGENDECLMSGDCCGALFCFNGICRKATPNAEFITLAKICLGITVTSIIVAALSSLLKCLMRFDRFHRFSRCRNSQSTNSTSGLNGHVLESQPPPNIMQEEKPPSYEECMLRIQTSSLTASPPPYVISSSEFTTSKQTCVFPV